MGIGYNLRKNNEIFTDFYDKYAQTTDTHIGKNQVSRTLNALGLKSIMKKDCCGQTDTSTHSLWDIAKWKNEQSTPLQAQL
ncbi:19576_t:CDS:2 [Entrophospora sp. SA101]|nr:19576_t:CDS:2 [Entrophospora sp. SA101]